MLQAPGTTPSAAGALGALRAVGTVLRVLSEPLLLVAAPSEARWNRTLGTLVTWGCAVLVLVGAAGYLAGRIGAAAATTWTVTALAALATAFVLGAAAGRPGRLWLAALLAAGVVFGVALRPALERLWFVLRPP
jgi:hypothetical protein